MKSILAFGLSALVALTVAAPYTTPSQTVTIQLADDLSGSNVDATIPINGQKISIDGLFGKLADAAGNILATSAQLNAFPQIAFECDIVNQDAITLGTLTPTKTFADLDGNPNETLLKNLNEGFIICQ